MNATCELLVIGAGPAGMAAAQTAANHGVDVMLVDEQANPGGQIYRNVDSDSALDAALLGKDYTFGRTMVRAFRHAHLDYRAKTGVWYLDQGSQAGLLHEGRSQLVNASYIVIASGAQERPVPIPNWQLPGVMTAGAGQILLKSAAGAGQILLKSAAVVPEDGVVLAGSGPLLLLLAWQYLQAGVRIRALLDTTPTTNRWR
ncbi:MAG: FAD-dependent oxidoreductase, partial [Pseudomonas stutzeri]|nr:FAD-dependent oxidoreductase [Stutzerimonas stutzeri]NIN81854.1 FAD-dependent oxidoreductase [Stutzerimonas stutzeri]NIP01091.1 FAD-dependent oxidoreductase [Stutzerimonas stutzeri]NIQ26434.1 FAD-dependent oxidoreductase [Gammaproteobacteria bacterium]